MAQYTVDDLKKIMTDKFIGYAVVQSVYGLDDSKTFDEHFAKTSVIGAIFYASAYIAWFIFSLFGIHKKEVDGELDKRLAPNVAWWRDKVLRFQFPNRNVGDNGLYDNTGLTADDITELEVVKFCAIEDAKATVKIKVAKGEAGNREPLSNDEVTGLSYYCGRITPAGVNYEIVNRQADKLFTTIDVYFNPLILNPSEKPVENAIKQYIQTLEFNDVLSRQKYIDNIQAVAGVIDLNPVRIQVQRALNPVENLIVQKIAESGYWAIENESTDLIVNYIPYSHENI